MNNLMMALQGIKGPTTTTTTTVVHDNVVITDAYQTGSSDFPTINVYWNAVAGASSYQFCSTVSGCYDTAATSVGGGIAQVGTNNVSVTAKFGGVPDYNTTANTTIEWI